MPNWKLVLLALYMMLSLGLPAFAHHESKDTRGQKHHHGDVTNAKKAKSSPDPWKQLALAFSPAYAALSNVNYSRSSYFRFVTSNGIPNHTTGAFPNPENPNSISEQQYVFRMSLNPKENYWMTPISMYPFGVAINGVPFDPGANEWYMRDRNSGWQYEAMALDSKLGIDQNNAHVQPDGAYHYHGLPTGLVNKRSSSVRPVLLGYAADGFPIYAPTGFPSKHGGRLRSSYRIKSGPRLSNGYGLTPTGNHDGSFVQDYEYVKGLGDLDESNGKHAVTPEYPRGTYLYVITDSYPYIPRSFRGTPDQTFINRGRSVSPAGGDYGYSSGHGVIANVRSSGYGGNQSRQWTPSYGGMSSRDDIAPPQNGMGPPPNGMWPPPNGMGPPDGMGPPPGFSPGGMEPPGFPPRH